MPSFAYCDECGEETQIHQFWDSIGTGKYFVCAKCFEKMRKEQQPPDPQAYYDVGGISVHDFIEAKKLDFDEGNVIKYVCRYKSKNGLEDLKKARRYLDFLIERYEK